MKKKLIIIIYIILVFLIVISIKYILKEFYWKKEAIKETKIIDTIEIDEKKVTKESSKKILQVRSLKQENQDVVGFLEIENTKINFVIISKLRFSISIVSESNPYLLKISSEF